MSWIYELLKNRYEKIWIPPWKYCDYILWQYGPLRPKNYGEMLFSDEYNYLIYTLYWSKVNKRLIFKGFYDSQIAETLIKTDLLAGFVLTPVILKLLFTSFNKPDFVRNINQITKNYKFPDFSTLLIQDEIVLRKMETLPYDSPYKYVSSGNISINPYTNTQNVENKIIIGYSTPILSASPTNKNNIFLVNQIKNAFSNVFNSPTLLTDNKKIEKPQTKQANSSNVSLTKSLSISQNNKFINLVTINLYVGVENS